MKTILTVVLLLAVLLCGCWGAATGENDAPSQSGITDVEGDSDENNAFPVIAIPTSSSTVGNTEAPTDSAQEEVTAGADDSYDDGEAVPEVPQ